MDDMEVIVFEDLPSKKTPLDADNLNKIQQNAKKAIKNRKPTIELLTVSSTVPSKCTIRDKYYNTTTSKIYTAIATNMWSITGENPSSLYLYADLEHKELYYYDETDFKSYGSGKKEVGYADEQLEGTEVILIEDSDFNGENSVELAKVEQNLSSNSENTVPSVQAVNDGIKTNVTTGQEVATNEYIDGKRVYFTRISINEFPGDNVTINHNINNIYEIIDYDATFVLATGETRKMPGLWKTDYSNFLSTVYQVTKKTMQLVFGSFWTSGTFKKAVITIKYTKNI